MKTRREAKQVHYRLADDAALRRRLEAWLSSGSDAEIAAALRAAPSPAAYARLWNAVCDVAQHSAGVAAESAIVARVFALPLVALMLMHQLVKLPMALLIVVKFFSDARPWAWLLISYAVLRNLPWYPFNLLAPG